jgi:hypothetical protein
MFQYDFYKIPERPEEMFLGLVLFCFYGKAPLAVFS